VKVLHLVTTRYSVPFRQPYVSAAGIATRREGLILQMTADNGMTGVGEAVLRPEVTDGGAKLNEALKAIAPAVVSGEFLAADIEDFLRESLNRGRTAEDAAVANALIMAADTFYSHVFAASHDQSLAEFFAGIVGQPSPAAEVPVNALVTAWSTGEAVRQSAEAVEAGFSAIKLKVGMATNVTDEQARIAAVREAIGPDVRLRLDANGAWSEQQAVETMAALAGYDIEYVEQPVAPGNLDMLKRARAAASILIAADEDADSTPAAKHVIEAGAADVLVLKPQSLGNFHSTAYLIGRARANGIGVVVTTTIDTGIGTAAALHLAASLSNGVAHGLATLPLLEDDVIKAPGLPIEAGVMNVPAAPGLGVECRSGCASGPA
jgi:o-succinylbenzoate synthase